MNIRKLLVPVDFSEVSVNALRYAAAFAKNSGASLQILHVHDAGSVSSERRGHQPAEHMLNLLHASDFLAGIRSGILFRNGAIAPVILEESRKNDIDLIVMGARGVDNPDGSLFGTHTKKVMDFSTCPVLAIPARAIYTPLHKVILAVEMNHHSDLLIGELVSLFKAQHAAILVVYIGREGEFDSERNRTALTEKIKETTGYQRVLCKVIQPNQFPEALGQFARDIEADMLLMITHHRGVFEPMFDHQRTNTHTFEPTIPFMAVPQLKTPVFFYS